VVLSLPAVRIANGYARQTSTALPAMGQGGLSTVKTSFQISSWLFLILGHPPIISLRLEDMVDTINQSQMEHVTLFITFSIDNCNF
jgi:hypothetical protein